MPQLPSILRLCLSVAFGLLVLARPAAAQIGGDQAVQMAEAAGMGKSDPGSFTGYLGFGQIGEDVFMNLNLRLSFDQEMWGIGVQAPLRFRIVDNDPQDESGFLNLRKEDWDEFQDYLRLLRYVYIGKRDKTGPFYVRVGQLDDLSIGHGTIVHRYYNSFDINTWRIGTNVAINAKTWGAEFVVSDAGRIATDPVLAGYRLYARPLKWFTGGGGKKAAPPPVETSSTAAPSEAKDDEEEEEESVGYDAAGRFVIGHSLMVDPAAPWTLQTEERRRLVLDPVNPIQQYTVIATDANNVPVVASERALVIVGIDVGYEILRGEPLAITPYIDLNKMNQVEDGWGLHMGVLWNLRVPVVIDTLTVDLRTEYRRVSGDYLGPYFNSTYDIERYVANPGSDSPLTKLAQTSMGGDARNGMFFDLLAGFPKWVYIGGEFIDYDGGANDGQLRLSLEVPALEFVRLSAFYYRINIEGAADLFALDDRSSIVAQAVVPISFLSVVGRWWRVWQAVPGGGYQAVDDWSVGVGLDLRF